MPLLHNKMFIMKQTDDNNINPSNSFCVITLLIILMIALMGLMSCSTHRVVKQVKEMHTDTVYVTSLQYDSIYIYNDKMLDRTKDTVYLRELSTEYRYKLLRDTLRIIESDTIYIPYRVKVADNGKDKSFLPRFSELARAAFLFVTAALALWVALRNKA